MLPPHINNIDNIYNYKNYNKTKLVGLIKTLQDKMCTLFSTFTQLMTVKSYN